MTHKQTSIEERDREREIGGNLHKILNQTVERKLTIGEYQKSIELISQLVESHTQAVRGEMIHEWNKAEQKLDGTTQGALSCIEHYRDFLQSLTPNEKK